MDENKNYFADHKDFVERCQKMCEKAGFQIPYLATNKGFNLCYQIREYDTHQDEEGSKEELEELIGEMWISLMCLMLYYNLDFDHVNAHMDEQIGR